MAKRRIYVRLPKKGEEPELWATAKREAEAAAALSAARAAKRDRAPGDGRYWELSAAEVERRRLADEFARSNRDAYNPACEICVAMSPGCERHRARDPGCSVCDSAGRRCSRHGPEHDPSCEACRVLGRPCATELYYRAHPEATDERVFAAPEETPVCATCVGLRKVPGEGGKWKACPACVGPAPADAMEPGGLAERALEQVYAAGPRSGRVAALTGRRWIGLRSDEDRAAQQFWRAYNAPAEPGAAEGGPEYELWLDAAGQPFGMDTETGELFPFRGKWEAWEAARSAGEHVAGIVSNEDAAFARMRGEQGKHLRPEAWASIGEAVRPVVAHALVERMLPRRFGLEGIHCYHCRKRSPLPPDAWSLDEKGLAALDVCPACGGSAVAIFAPPEDVER